MAEDIRPGHIARQREAVPILVQPFPEHCVVDREEEGFVSLC